MAEERKSGTIRIGDLVQLKFPIRIVHFDEYTLKVEVQNGVNFDWLIVPRCISALGQFLPGHNWKVPSGMYSLTDNFHYTGRYHISSELYQAEEHTQEELDEGLSGYLNDELDGGIIIGRVVFIYATYIHSTQPNDDTIEFFDTSEEAQHDHYAHQTVAIIQDLSSDIEYPVNLKLLKKV